MGSESTKKMSPQSRKMIIDSIDHYVSAEKIRDRTICVSGLGATLSFAIFEGYDIEDVIDAAREKMDDLGFEVIRNILDMAKIETKARC